MSRLNDNCRSRKFVLVVFGWAGDRWWELVRRGFDDRDIAEMLGREEVARLPYKTNYRKLGFSVFEQAQE
jgi:hypothetical protein